MKNQNVQEELDRQYVGKLATYVTDTGIEEIGLVLAIDLQGKADLKLFVGGPAEVVKKGVPSRVSVDKPPHWQVKCRVEE